MPDKTVFITLKEELFMP